MSLLVGFQRALVESQEFYSVGIITMALHAHIHPWDEK
jgi:hypothetical protein